MGQGRVRTLSKHALKDLRGGRRTHVQTGVQTAVFFKTEYLSWRQQISQDLIVSSALCLGERVLERILFPGLHRVTGRMVTDDPTRVDSLSVLLAEAFGLFALIWVFFLTLYAISWLTTRPLKSYATTLVAGALMLVVFVSSLSQWFLMPNPPAG
jgi:hypothetical protein